MSGQQRLSEIPTTFWLAACIALVIGIALQVDWGRHWTRPLPEFSSSSTTYVSPALAMPFDLPSLDNFPETRLRPIFSPGRRSTETSSPAQANAFKERFVLTGTTLTPEGRFAFLSDLANNKTLVVHQGKELHGFRVMEVRDRRIVLTRNGMTEVVNLTASKPQATRAYIEQPVAPATAEPESPRGSNTDNPAGGAEPPLRP